MEIFGTYRIDSIRKKTKGYGPSEETIGLTITATRRDPQTDVSFQLIFDTGIPNALEMPHVMDEVTLHSLTTRQLSVEELETG